MLLSHAFTALAIIIAPLSGEQVTNETIVALTAAGLGDDAIIAKIEGSDAAFDLSTEQMIALRKQGVSGPVIAAMLKSTNKGNEGSGAMSMDSPDPAVRHPAGFYLLQGEASEAKMVRIDPTVSNQAKTGGIFGYALTGGLASLSVKAAIQNETARISTAAHAPVFYLFFDESNGNAGSAWASGIAATVSSPNEFTLIRLERKKGRREARVGSMNIGGAKTGVMDKDRIAFTYDMVRPGVFKVTPSMDLTAGEYGFIYSITGGGAAGAMSARIFDFSVH